MPYGMDAFMLGIGMLGMYQAFTCGFFLQNGWPPGRGGGGSTVPSTEGKAVIQN